MNSRIRSIDNIILKGLLGGSTLSQILQDVSDETMLELCLYSLNLRPMLSFASPDMHVRFEAVFSQLSAEADRYPAYTEINADNGFYIIAPIIKERNQLGFLMLFAPADIWGANDNISYISERLSKLCARLAMPDSLSSTYSDFEKLWASNLLLNTNSNAKLVSSNPFICRLRGSYVICAFQHTDQNPAKLKSAESYVKAFLRNALYIIKGNYILAFLYDCDHETASALRHISTQLEAFCRSCDLFCGVSSFFTDIAERNRYIEEAISCLSFASKSSMLVYARNMYLPLFFRRIAEVWGKDTFHLYSLRRIAEYDKENNTEYYSTLKAYLMSHGRILQTASSLYIDHSTLLYRLKRIREIFELDISSPHVMNLMRLGIINYETTSSIPGG